MPTDSGYYHVEANNPYPSQVISSNAILIVPNPPYALISATNSAVVAGFTTGVWKYNQTGTDLGIAWQAVGYDDSSWPSGLGVLAKEDNVNIVPLIHTVLSLTNSMMPGTNGTNLTFYFRTQFNLTNDPSTTKIITSNLVDDAHVVYVNGVEAYRSTNMPVGAVTYNTVARIAHEENVWEMAEIPSSLLIRGTNTLAVEVHQSALTSSDIVLGLAVVATFPPPTTAPIITNQPANVTVQELKPAAFTVGYLGESVTLQWFKQHTNDAGADLVPGGIWPTLALTNPLVGVDDGNYFVVLSNLLGITISSNAFLTVLPDTNGPVLQYADGTGSSTVITLTFDERMMAYDTNNPTGSPTNPANYTVTNTFGETLSVVSVQFLNGSTNDTNIVLTTSGARRTDANYIVTVKSLRDVAPRHNLSTNLACPVSSLLKIIKWNDAWTFTQPWPEDDKTAFNNHNWAQPAYFADFDNPPFWASGAAVFYAYYTSAEMADWPAQGIQSINASGDFGSNAYFRLTFNYQASPAGASAWMRYLLDDGGAFYINGTEFHRYNMPTGAVTFNTSASTTITDPQTQGPTNIALSSLSLGTNLIAVEIHRYLPGADYDLAFGLEMQARIDSLVTGKVVITTAPGDLTVFQGDPASFNFRGVAGSSFQWLSNSVRIAGATSPAYQIASAPLSANGAHYSIVVSNYTGAVTSAPALLTVLPDTNAPVLVSAYLTASNVITVSFSEPITPDSASLTNFAVNEALGGTVAITGVSLNNGTNVVLTFGALPPGTYTVVVNNVKDVTVGNRILPNSPVTVGLQNYPLVTDGVTIWRYDQGNEDLGTAWRAFSYDDSSWSNGLALFDGKRGGRTVADAAAFPEPIKTTLDVTNALTPVNSIPTYYFRTKFTAPVLGAGATMTVRHVIDDGAAFYLNGQLLYAIRVNTPTAFGTYGGTGSTSTGNDIPIMEGPFNVPTTYLTAGTNLLAVEVKNVNTNSSDITFGAILYLSVPSQVLSPPTGQGPAITSGPTVTPSTSVFTGQSFTNTVVASGTAPLSYLWRKGSVSLGRITASTPFFNVTTNDSGAYSVVITNAFGAITSTVVNVTVKPLPRLFVAATNSHRVVVWWTNSEPLVLEATNKVGSVAGAWTYVTNNRPYIVFATNAAQFYRLKY